MNDSSNKITRALSSWSLSRSMRVSATRGDAPCDFTPGVSKKVLFSSILKDTSLLIH